MIATLPAGHRGQYQIGCTMLANHRAAFRVWAPKARQVHVICGEREVPMTPEPRGYHTAVIDDVIPGETYRYRLDADTVRPDPASRLQPQGVHGPSAVAASDFPWTDTHWHGLPLKRCVFYELHIGTFSGEGTFYGAIAHLDALQELGITVVEIMPVAQFPGSRNWGYDGVYPFAVQTSYGGINGLKRLVDACHNRGLAVALDVVYNHLGPEGNYLNDFGPYFTSTYHTPWGEAMNFDGPGSDEVRAYFIANALMWIDEFHIDMLRLDAVHAIVDRSAYPFLHELRDAAHEHAAWLNRTVHVIAESDLNDPRLARHPTIGGYGLDALWSDDLHHALHALLTSERDGYYEDFGELDDLAAALQQSFVYDGRYSAYRQRHHGTPADDLPSCRFVVCAQNHDQVGNRAQGERLAAIVTFEQVKLAAAVVVCSTYLPLLFMGEEYGEVQPFLYFISHEDPALVEAVRKGRREEFAHFTWTGEIPDPHAVETFRKSTLDRSRADLPKGRGCREFFKALLATRAARPALAALDRRKQQVVVDNPARTLLVRRWCDNEQLLLAYNFADAPSSISADVPNGQWKRVMHSAESRFAGPGVAKVYALRAASKLTIELEPFAFVMLERVEGEEATQ